MKILVSGAGAMGSRFASVLQKGGAEVVLFDIDQEHTAAINRNGLEIHSEEKTEHYSIKACSSIEGQTYFTHILVFTKSIHTASALEFIKPIISRDVVLITLQNGLGNIETLRAFAPQNPIIAGITNYTAFFIRPGVIRADGSGITKFQALPPADQQIAEEFAEVLHRGGMAGDVVDNILRHIWGKIAFNAALNTITALTGLSVGLVGSTPEAQTLAFNVAKDVAKTARSAGIDLDDDEAVDSIKTVMRPEMSANHYPSMFQDVSAKRKTEIETICGKVLEAAEKAGINVPYVHAVYLLIRAIEDNYPNRKF